MESQQEQYPGIAQIPQGTVLAHSQTEGNITKEDMETGIGKNLGMSRRLDITEKEANHYGEQTSYDNKTILLKYKRWHKLIFYPYLLHSTLLVFAAFRYLNLPHFRAHLHIFLPQFYSMFQSSHNILDATRDLARHGKAFNR